MCVHFPFTAAHSSLIFICFGKWCMWDGFNRPRNNVTSYWTWWLSTYQSMSTKEDGEASPPVRGATRLLWAPLSCSSSPLLARTSHPLAQGTMAETAGKSGSSAFLAVYRESIKGKQDAEAAPVGRSCPAPSWRERLSVFGPFFPEVPAFLFLQQGSKNTDSDIGSPLDEQLAVALSQWGSRRRAAPSANQHHPLSHSFPPIP